MKMLTFILLLFPLHWLKVDDVLARFNPPNGYHQIAGAPGSFGDYLQHLPLMPSGTPARTYRGDIAATNVYTAAVVNISVGHADLQQCADAVMRLRGEYLYHQKRYSEIAFHFESGFRCDFVHYANGYRCLNGHWLLKRKKDYRYANFMRYMKLVFEYAGTISLQKELKKVHQSDQIKTGDIFIRGGSPGHCFIVMDVVKNNGGQKKFLLAQSYMPAQNIQVLQYMGDPWFSLDAHSDITYGELIDSKYLRSF